MAKLLTLRKRFRITHTQPGYSRGAPIKLELEQGKCGLRMCQSRVEFDKEAFRRHAITPSLYLMERELQCTLTCCSPKPWKEENRKDGSRTILVIEKRHPEEVVVEALTNEECYAANEEGDKPLTRTIQYSLVVVSADRMSRIPAYRIFVDLSRSEFEKCVEKMKCDTIITARFALIPKKSSKKRIKKSKK